MSQGDGRLRFVQGLAVRPGSGQFYATEHGTFRDEEVTLLRPGGQRLSHRDAEGRLLVALGAPQGVGKVRYVPLDLE